MITVSRGKADIDEKLFQNYCILYQEVVSSVRDLGCAALDLVCRSWRARSNIQLRLNTYDFAAGVFIIQEAGGKVTNLNGTPWEFPENHFIASNGVFHDLLVEEVQKQIKNLKA